MLRYLAALSLVACSHAAHVAAPIVVDAKPTAPANAEPPRVDTIVLFGDHASAELDANGAELDANSALLRVAAGTRVLAVKQEEAKDKLTCDLDFDGTPFHETGDFYSRSLALAGASGPDLVLVAPEKKEAEPNVVVEAKMSASLTAVVGPYAFVSVAQSFFGCGAAHPIGGVSASVWNVRTGQVVELTAPDGAAETARAALKDRGFDGDVTLVEARPHFDDAGHLSLRWRFEKAAAYAETDGEGHAYTVSTWVDADVLPADLAAYADPPPALAQYLKTHPGPITGWSRLD